MKKRNFILLNGSNGDTKHKFTGKKPWFVAKKVASRGHTEIRLRETKTKRVHIYKGWRTEKDNTKCSVDWLRKCHYVGHVKKITIEKL